MIMKTLFQSMMVMMMMMMWMWMALDLHQLLPIVIPTLLDQALVEPNLRAHARAHHPSRADLCLEDPSFIQNHGQTGSAIEPVPQALALEQEAQLRGQRDKVWGDG